MIRFVQFLERLRHHSAQQCIIGNGRSYTYADLLEESKRWRVRLDELNVEPGTVVGLRADYSLASIAALLALFARRAVVALIPRKVDAAAYLSDARASAFIELTAEEKYSWHSIPHPQSHPLLDRLRATKDGGVIIFTSGSTGRPKAALQSVERFLYKFQKPTRCFRTLAFLLFDHVAGLDTLFYTLSGAGTLILTRSRDPRSILSLIQSHKVEVLPTSPSFLRLLCSAKDSGEHDLSSLRIITYGSEPMDPSTLARLNALFPNVQLTQKYGTTETGSPRTVSRDSESLWLKIKSDGVETKIVDDVLWIRSQSAMLGYLNADSPVDEDGWYCTDDLVDVDGEWIKFRGRATDIINVGGEKVAPVEVEQSILELDFVRDAAVSAEPHPLMGRVVTARVVLAADAPEPKEATKRIRLHCRERLLPYKVPVKIDIQAEGLTSDRQKVQRKRASKNVDQEDTRPGELTQKLASEKQ